MKPLRLLFALFLATPLFAAETNSPPASGGLAQSSAAAVVTKLFAGIPGFTAQAEMRVLDKAGREQMRTPMQYAWRAGAVRMDVDLAQIQSGNQKPEMVAGLRRMGMDRQSSIMLPMFGRLVMIYPTLQGFAELPLPKQDAAVLAEEFKIERAELGREKAGGHDCVKQRVTFTGKLGRKVQATVWAASGLEKFPVQVEIEEGAQIVAFRFSEVKLAVPDEAFFAPPAGYTRFPTMSALVQAAQRRLAAEKK
ncbi:MAG: hypothetical protein EXS29_04400 [Pedosphaera sp.]|nr:hypothetical protein [Pedosphaera sp.]MST00538.1 hypothetical protein [Pedosphaera sp.]